MPLFPKQALIRGSNNIENATTHLEFKQKVENKPKGLFETKSDKLLLNVISLFLLIKALETEKATWHLQGRLHGIFASTEAMLRILSSTAIGDYHYQ